MVFSELMFKTLTDSSIKYKITTRFIEVCARGPPGSVMNRMQELTEDPGSGGAAAKEAEPSKSSVIMRETSWTRWSMVA